MWTVLMLLACKEVSRVESHDIDVGTMSALRASVDHGSFAYDLGAPDSFGIRAESWGHASTARRAAEREAANFLDIAEGDTTLALDAVSGFRRAGWDVQVFGPPVVNLDVLVDRGEVFVAEAEGVHRLVGDRVETIALRGDADIVADLTGVDAELLPGDDSAVTIDSYGKVVLRLPKFLPYDIQVLADAGQLLTADDIGFDEVVIEDGFLSAWRNPGTIRIRVDISQGTFELHEAF